MKELYAISLQDLPPSNLDVLVSFPWSEIGASFRRHKLTHCPKQVQSSCFQNQSTQYEGEESEAV